MAETRSTDGRDGTAVSSTSDMEKVPAAAPADNKPTGSDLESGDKENNVPETTPAIPPEEGLQGWLCVLGAFFTLFCSFGFLNAIGVFQDYYQQNELKDYSPSEISWIFTVQLALMWAPGPLFGRLTDTYGAPPVLWPCSLLCVFALCMTSLCTKYSQIFLAQGLAFGIGSGGVFTCSFICVGQWFIKRRGLAIGIASVGSSLGGVIFPIFLYKIIGEVGFFGAIRYTALLVGILLAGSVFLVKARLPRKKWDGKAKWFEPKLFLEAKFALYTIGAFLVMWGLWAPFDFISTFASTQGFDPFLAVALISLINATSIPGRIIPPYMADTIGHFNVVTVSSAGVSITILALWLPFDFHRSVAGVIVFSLVYGFVSGAFVCLLLPCVAKTGPLETMGMRFGTFQLVISISTLTGLPIAGAILARQEEKVFWGLQTFALLAAGIGAVCIGVATRLFGQQMGSWKI